ncbi:hypothetical protein [Hanstruepera marina]|uniref:hypothetical protein n=1 Tax=Hanstruepera marina TaxID=2873265 RepID=UPI001CA64B47|nr:hypothetical protein [Hanstruepera marina]
MKINHFCLFILLLTFSLTNAQNDSIKSIEEQYIDYFSLNHETIYTQLNKTKFFTAEDLWFKTYVYYTKTQKPYRRTTNIYASIFDSKGNLIEKKLLFAKNGMTSGNFDLKPDYPPGTYYLKVSTNWMRNFKEDHYSLDKFQIVGANSEENISKNTLEKEFDFQVLPEGGHALNHVINNFGYKIIDKKGESVKIDSGYVIDSQNNKITTFKSNDFGMGQFSLLIDEKEHYTAVAILKDGKTVRKPLPLAKPIGVVMNVFNNTEKSDIAVAIKTNKASLPKLVDKSYFLLVHRDGLVYKINVKFEPNKHTYLLKIPKANLYSGINIITLFNDSNQPISERLTYNYTDKSVKNILLLGFTKEEDSTIVRFGFNGKKDSISQNMSVSVLPAITKSYNQDKTILSKFLLSPYVKGHIENPNYYFNSESPKAAYDLDVLLITQGWSKYSWSNIFNSPPKSYFPFEFGITINGTISDKNDLSQGEIMLVSGLNEIFLRSDIKPGNKFTFEKLYLSDDSRVFFSLKDKSGRVTTPKVYFNAFPNLIKESIRTETDTMQEDKLNLQIRMDEFIYDNVTILDTVDLKHSRDTLRHTSRYTNRYESALRVGSSDYRNIYARSNRNYDIRIFEGQYGRYAGSGRYSNNIYGQGGYFGTRDVAPGDFNQIFTQHNPMIRSNLASQTHSTIFNAVSAPNFDYQDYQKKAMIEIKNSMIEFGFSRPETYYTPFYNKSQRDTFAAYGVLHWIPNVTSNSNGIFSFKIPNYFYGSINLHINGMGNDGSLFSKVETIDLK